MLLRNTESAYGAVARLFHWAIALSILGMLLLGFTMQALEASPLKLSLYWWHKSFGNLILLLVGLRLLWRFINVQPKPLPNHMKIEKFAAHGVHFLLYAALFAMPLSGWLMSSAADFANPFFGLFEMPDLSAPDRDLFEAMRDAHGIIAYAIIGLVAVHVAGAFKHHFIDKDETLRRMIWAGFGFKSGLALLVFVALSGFAVLLVSESGGREMEFTETERQERAFEREEEIAEEAESGEWAIIKENSAIAFEATQYGKAFAGEFNGFSGKIRFDPADLEASRADIRIDIASIATGSGERDAQARSAEWFDAQSFPQARFKSESFTPLGGERYEVRGNLQIRDIKLPVSFPFTLRIEKGENGMETAFMEGELVLNRLDFGIGQGQWQSTEIIGESVTVRLRVQAMRGG